MHRAGQRLLLSAHRVASTAGTAGVLVLFSCQSTKGATNPGNPCLTPGALYALSCVQTGPCGPLPTVVQAFTLPDGGEDGLGVADTLCGSRETNGCHEKDLGCDICDGSFTSDLSADGSNGTLHVASALGIKCQGTCTQDCTDICTYDCTLTRL